MKPNPIQEHFILGMSRISAFWGLPKALGAIFGALYLSPQPLSQEDLCQRVGVTKGAISTNLRQLQRLGMVRKIMRVGERKDYYAAETDFWQIAKGILRKREQSEFDHALRTVDESIQMLPAAELSPDQTLFIRQRLENMQRFFKTVDNLVAMLITLDEFRLSALQRLFNTRNKGE